jgi:hypothetical protein
MLLTPRRGRAVSGSSSRPESSVPYRVDLRKGSISAAGLNWAGKQFGLSKHQGGNHVIGNDSAHHFGAVVNRGAA